jgi:hypothetical protein
MDHVRLALVSLLATLACNQEIGQCIPGTVRCVCEGGGSCEPSLVCIDNRCEPLDDVPVGEDVTGMRNDASSSSDGSATVQASDTRTTTDD